MAVQGTGTPDAEGRKLEWMVRTDRHVLVRLQGEDFTVAKFLQEELLAHKAVTFASCDVQQNSVVLCVRIELGRGHDCAKDAILQALRAMRAKCDGLSRMCAERVHGYSDTPGYSECRES
jgi:DNA-directed RNA polymerase subunit L